jgi:alanine racemase
VRYCRRISAYIAVVKANAYGHGYAPTVARLMQNGVDAFAVANLKEAEAIREMGGGWPIMILSPLLPQEAEGVVALKVIPTISSPEEAQRYIQIARRHKARIPVQLKVDSGMGRAGVWHTQALALAQQIIHSEQLSLEGIYTHFASADTDLAFTTLQRRRFAKVVNSLPLRPALIHADNSAGFETFPNDPLFTAVRIGRLQFGFPPYRGAMQSRVAVEPILSFYSRLCLIKELPRGASVSYSRTHTLRRRSRVGIVAAGYADGVPTHVSNIASMLVRGQRCPVIGRVTMDMTMLDLTDLPEAQAGDLVTIVGRDQGAEISLIELAQWAGSVPWEILSSITGRVPRLYKMSLGV